MGSTFYELLGERIIKVLGIKPLSLCGIVKESDGAYPDDVLIAIDILIKSSEVELKTNLYYRTNFKYLSENSVIDKHPENVNLIWVKEAVASLSSPHPADYDWRFTAQTIFDLSKMVVTQTNEDDSIALFGTTTLFPVIKRLNPMLNLSLYNKSQSLIDDLRRLGFNKGLHVHDLFKNIGDPSHCDLVIADPPWYNDFYNAFISRASDLLNLGGLLYLSVLPKFTRPEAINDRTYIDSCCERNGFKKIQSIDGFLKYESPTFERHSLNQFNCPDWRSGDLIIYEKIEERKSLVDIEMDASEPLWDEYLLNGIKLKLLKLDDDADQFSFEYADETRLLNTVSRRSPIRKRINFWTSENYAFKVHKLKVLRHLFRFADSYKSLDIALNEVKSAENLTKNEIDSLCELLKNANLYISG